VNGVCSLELTLANISPNYFAICTAVFRYDARLSLTDRTGGSPRLHSSDLRRSLVQVAGGHDASQTLLLFADPFGSRQRSPSVGPDLAGQFDIGTPTEKYDIRVIEEALLACLLSQRRGGDCAGLPQTQVIGRDLAVKRQKSVTCRQDSD
jgi:hypothetical protein